MLRIVGGGAAIAGTLLGLALWLFVKDTLVTKVAVGLLYVVLAILGLAFVSIAAAFTVAQVREGKLNFHFAVCGCGRFRWMAAPRLNCAVTVGCGCPGMC